MRTICYYGSTIVLILHIYPYDVFSNTWTIIPHFSFPILHKAAMVETHGLPTEYPYQETGALTFVMSPPFAGHGGKYSIGHWDHTQKILQRRNSCNWSLRDGTRKYLPRPRQCLGCLLACLTAWAMRAAAVKQPCQHVFWEYLGQSSVFVVGKTTKGTTPQKPKT